MHQNCAIKYNGEGGNKCCTCIHIYVYLCTCIAYINAGVTACTCLHAYFLYIMIELGEWGSECTVTILKGYSILKFEIVAYYCSSPLTTTLPKRN